MATKKCCECISWFAVKRDDPAAEGMAKPGECVAKHCACDGNNQGCYAFKSEGVTK